MAVSVQDIKKELEAAQVDMLPQLIEKYKDDPRSGVIKLLESAGKRIKALEAEKARIKELWMYEEKYSEFSA